MTRPRGAAPVWTVCWLGQAGFALRAADGTRVLVDPYLSNVCYRFSRNLRRAPAALDPATVGTDLLLLTHEHRDHCDPGLVPRLLDETGCRAAGPPGTVARCEHDFGAAPGRVRAVRAGDEIALGAVTVRVVPARHTVDAVGYLVSCRGVGVYVSGDTRRDPELYSCGRFEPDLAAVCVNGMDTNMTVPDAVAHVRELGARLAVPMHIELFDDNHDLAVDFARELDAEPDGPRPLLPEPGVAYALDSARRPAPLGPIREHWAVPEPR